MSISSFPTRLVLEAEEILTQYDRARAYLAKALEKEADEKIRQNQRQLAEVEQRIDVYNQVVEGINSCLEAMQLDYRSDRLRQRHRLPILDRSVLFTNDNVESVEDFVMASDSN